MIQTKLDHCDAAIRPANIFPDIQAPSTLAPTSQSPHRPSRRSMSHKAPDPSTPARAYRHRCALQEIGGGKAFPSLSQSAADSAAATQTASASRYCLDQSGLA
jgi:hypothetical protein